ncbi:ABC transporter substrate-binding protein [Chelatococcus reniformis]|uniref:Branched-chain amino acid ABC transporter substrate-binding protein n=1 Tax=Chelatococcus reniformis TaxID=1494448 RepID=A0A916X7T9_9HYPH|nr:ABC transporter substrate-binding protein [Chelatococcus reniformis]GGC47743.1 branched-chain amino acid ABC transporter substrate-binding protein [Chelatococcus reniformis]
MIKSITRRVVLAAAVAGLAAPALAQGADRGPVKLGAVLSLSGPAAVFGIPERDAIQAVLKQMHSTTPDGRRIDLVLVDDKSNPTEAARAVSQVINNDQVVAIIGPSTGSGILAAGPIAQRLKVPLLGPAGTLAITDPKNEFYPWVFRVAPSDIVDIRVILRDMAKSKTKKVGIFYQEDAYGKTGVDEAKIFGPTIGLNVVDTVSAPYTATDLTAQATKLRNAGVEAVFLQVSISALGSSFLKAARQVGLDVPIYANAGLAQRSFAENTGPEAEGLRVLSIGNIPFDPVGGEVELAKMLQAEGKVPQGWGELVGTNALMAAVAAIDAQKGKEITGESMRDTLETLCNFKAYARGKACFAKDKHDGWGEDALVITELRNKQLKTLD